MIRVRSKTSRRPPVATGDPELDRREEQRYQRIVNDEVRQDVADLAASVGPDDRVRVTFKSKGPGVEVQVEHSLGMAPDSWTCVDRDDYSSPKRSRGTLGNANFVWFKTNAPVGSSFTVVLWKSAR